MSAGGSLRVDSDQIERFVSALFRYADEGTFVSLRAFDQFDANRPAFFQSDSHRTFVMRQTRTVGLVKAPSHAPEFSQLRTPSRKLDGSFVEESDPPIGIRRVNGCRKRLQKLMKAIVLCYNLIQQLQLSPT